MKALTLRQPWATLVAIGAKKIETRSWTPNYRGPLAIHAAKQFSKSDYHHWEPEDIDSPAAEVLPDMGPGLLRLAARLLELNTSPTNQVIRSVIIRLRIKADIEEEAIQLAEEESCELE